MGPKKSSKATNDVESLLEDLDNLVPKSDLNPQDRGNSKTENRDISKGSATAATSTTSTPSTPSELPTSSHSAADAQSLLDDLDSLVQQRRSTSTTTRLSSTSTPQQSKQPNQSQPVTATPSTTSTQSVTESNPSASETTATLNSGGWSGWGGSVWSSATRIADQARLELERRAQEAATAYDQLQKPITTSQNDSKDGKQQSGSGKDSGDDLLPVSDPTLPITNATPQEQERARETAEILRKEISRRGWAFAQGLKGLVAEGGLEKLGSNLSSTTRKGLTDLLNAVAPPISSHEVLQVTLSHDLKGYEGISDVVFRVLTSVIETHHSNLRSEVGDGEFSAGLDQQLVVNKAPDRKDGKGVGGERPKDDGNHDERDLNAVEGFEAAKKLAQAELDSLIKSHPSNEKKEGEPSSSSDAAISNLTVPVKNCPIFVRIQPVISDFPWSSTSTSSSNLENQDKEGRKAGNLFFIVLLKDPGNGLSHEVLSQSLPRHWMDIPFEENVWVEQALVDVLQGALSVIGQEYVNGRGRSRVNQLSGSQNSTDRLMDSKDEKTES